MQHRCKVSVIRKELYKDLQEEYLANKESGECPFYNVGDEFIFDRYGDKDDFWTMGRGSQCSEAWDCISRYIYTALQGGAIMRGWSKNDKIMIACCNDGTRPVIFKIERIDYYAIYIKDIKNNEDANKIQNAIKAIYNVDETKYISEKSYIEVIINEDVPEHIFERAVKNAGDFQIEKID